MSGTPAQKPPVVAYMSVLKNGITYSIGFAWTDKKSMHGLASFHTVIYGTDSYAVLPAAVEDWMKYINGNTGYAWEGSTLHCAPDDCVILDEELSPYVKSKLELSCTKPMPVSSTHCGKDALLTALACTAFESARMHLMPDGSHARPFIAASAYAVHKGDAISVGIAWSRPVDSPCNADGPYTSNSETFAYDNAGLGENPTQQAVINAVRQWHRRHEHDDGFADCLVLPCMPSHDGHIHDALTMGHVAIAWGLCGFDPSDECAQPGPAGLKAKTAFQAAMSFFWKKPYEGQGIQDAGLMMFRADDSRLYVGIAWDDPDSGIHSHGWAIDGQDDGTCAAAALAAWARLIDSETPGKWHGACLYYGQDAMPGFEGRASHLINEGRLTLRRLAPEEHSKIFNAAKSDHKDVLLRLALEACNAQAYKSDKNALQQSSSTHMRKVNAAVYPVREGDTIAVGIAWNCPETDPATCDHSSASCCDGYSFKINALAGGPHSTLLENAAQAAIDDWRGLHPEKAMIFVDTSATKIIKYDRLKSERSCILWGRTEFDPARPVDTDDPVALRGQAAYETAMEVLHPDGQAGHNTKKKETDMDNTASNKSDKTIQPRYTGYVIAFRDNNLNLIFTGIGWTESGTQPRDTAEVHTEAAAFTNDSIGVDLNSPQAMEKAVSKAIEAWAGKHAKDGSCSDLLFIDAGLFEANGSCLSPSYHNAKVTYNFMHADGVWAQSTDPNLIRAHAARLAAEEFKKSFMSKPAAASDNGPSPEDDKNSISVVITAGPSYEKADGFTDFVSKATGRTGARIAETLLNARGDCEKIATQIDKIYYLSAEGSVQPSIPDYEAYSKLKFISVENADSLLDELDKISHADDNIKLVVHACAVCNYKARREVSIGALAREIYDYMDRNKDSVSIKDIREILKNPDPEPKKDVMPSDKIMVLRQTPNVTAHLRDIFKDAVVFNFGLACNAGPQEIFEASACALTDHKLDYVVAGDVASINKENRPVMFIGHDASTGRPAVISECSGHEAIADTVCSLMFGPETDLSDTGLDDKDPGYYWNVISASNSDTNIQINDVAKTKKEAWSIMLGLFKIDVSKMLPNVDIGYVDMRIGFKCESSDGSAGASISHDRASVCKDSYMRYYNLVPVPYTNITGGK